jgi:hypothetical protein
MTAEVLRKIYKELDFGLRQQFKDSYTNAKERRMVKNAIRSMTAQKQVPKWEVFAEKYLEGKATFEDVRKVAELQQYFEAELEKAAGKKSSSGQTG